MTREEYIKAVKVKLEEISPFDEPQSFIAAGDDADYQNVKPIISYIDSTLDEAAHDCLNSLPLSLLHADIEHISTVMHINAKGVGIVSGLSDTLRLTRFCNDTLNRDITAFITSEDPLYLLQQNRYTRGGIAKPVAVWSSGNDAEGNGGQLEIYSFPASKNNSTAATRVLGIETKIVAESVKSPIEEYIILRCAYMVSQILGDINTTQQLIQEYTNKLNAELQ